MDDSTSRLHIWFLRSDSRPRQYFALTIVLALFGPLWAVRRLLWVSLGNSFDTDAVDVWYPFAKGVLGGHAPYVQPVWDNKPPLFQLVNVAVAATGQYFTVFVLLMGIVNAVLVLLTVRWYRQYDAPAVGLIAVAFFVAAFSVTGSNIAAKNFSILFMLLALVAAPRGILLRGFLLGCGTLCSQFVVFATPGLLLDTHLRTAGFSDRFDWLKGIATFGLGGVCAAAIAFGFIWVAWSPEVAWHAIRSSGGLADNYVTSGGGSMGTLYGHPVEWIIWLIGSGEGIGFLLLPATFGAVVSLSNWPVTSDLRKVLLVLCVGLSFSLTVRPWIHYWFLMFPFLGGLAALGFIQVYETFGLPSVTGRS